MQRLVKFFKKPRLGAGLTEYILLVAVIAIAAIALLTIFSTSINGQFGNAAKRITAGK